MTIVIYEIEEFSANISNINKTSFILSICSLVISNNGISDTNEIVEIKISEDIERQYILTSP